MTPNSLIEISSQDRAEWVEDRDAAFIAALGLLGDQAAFAGVDLAGDDDEVLLESHVAVPKPPHPKRVTTYRLSNVHDDRLCAER